MKILVILLLILLIIKLIKPKKNNVEKFDNYEEYIIPEITIGKSEIGGRGVFAKRDYKKGEILEVCPIIVDNFRKCYDKIHDYDFNYHFDKEKKKSAVAMGYCAMYNHSDNNNVKWDVLNDQQMKIKVIKDIKKGEEIFVSYGSGYWESREGKKN